jgi:cation:H+ antiporter
VAVDLVFVVVGLAVLARGADVFVIHAARLAAAVGASPVVIGAVVVGFGTGVPELLVSSSAAARGELEIAVGNLIGSNLANLTLVLGVGGLIARPEIVPRVLRREAPLSFAAVALFALAIQGGLTRTEGVVLLGALVVALVVMLRVSEDAETTVEEVPGDEEAEEDLVDEVEDLLAEGDGDGDGSGATQPAGAGSRALVSRDLLLTVAGLLATVAGAQFLVVGATGVAGDLGLSGGFVGLTLVAVGTSLPELVTAVQSARRDETALLVGNVLGSNVFNSLAVGGTTALLAPGLLDDPGLTRVAAGSMVLVAGLAWLFLYRRRRLGRGEALLLLAIYAVTVPLVGS